VIVGTISLSGQLFWREDIPCSELVRYSHAPTLKIHMKIFIKKLIKNMSG
jgi:hypothetical protein